MTHPAPIASDFAAFVKSAAAALEKMAHRLTYTIEQGIYTIEQGIEAAAANYRRARQCDAYRKRLYWKKSDKDKVMQLAPSPVALRRLERATGLGRPSVKDYVPFGEAVRNTALALKAFYDLTTPGHERLRILKNTPWYDHFVEAVYSGALAEARALRMRDASGHAREVTRLAFHTNQDAVKDAVSRARAEQRANEWGQAWTMQLSELEHWKRTGELPDRSSLP
jgi:hypothetical protein